MPQFRYHRMAENQDRWTRPHGGRLGKSADYVGENGYGHEDWNFARDIWEDGKLHLYLRQGPAQKDREQTFNIALGVRTDIGHALIGFAENVRYGVSNLSDRIWERRAKELKALDDQGELGGEFAGLGVDELTAKIKEIELRNYSVAVEPDQLVILPEEQLIPKATWDVKSKRYQLLKIDEEIYNNLRSLARLGGVEVSNTEETFPEGALVERFHRSRERNTNLVKRAKERFQKLNGSLRCEICDFDPSAFFKNGNWENSIIEAHHDVPLGSLAHTGETRLEELRMLCPNCHRAIHKVRPWQPVDEFKKAQGF